MGQFSELMNKTSCTPNPFKHASFKQKGPFVFDFPKVQPASASNFYEISPKSIKNPPFLSVFEKLTRPERKKASEHKNPNHFSK